jgi:hypothetical protein
MIGPISEMIMRITNYSFGKITVDGKTYTSDIIIYPDFVDAGWWRKEGHYLQAVDLERAINFRPDVLIIGRGILEPWLYLKRLPHSSNRRG